MPDWQAVEMCRAGICPLCGRDGWKSVPSHVAMGHRIDGRDFRNMLGLTWIKGAKGVSLARPEAADLARRRMLAKIAEGKITGATGPRPGFVRSPVGEANRKAASLAAAKRRIGSTMPDSHHAKQRALAAKRQRRPDGTFI